MEAIKTLDLCKEYPDTVAVKGLNLEIFEGELFALLGVNGAGKTTTIKMLTCLTRPSGGDAFVCGYSILRDAEKIKALIDVSMQETAIARNLTVAENIRFYAQLNGQSREEIDKTTAYLFDAFELGKVKDKRAASLSGGWQRKLSIALALVTHPKVLFLDEPTLGLDVIARREIWKTIRDLRKNMTIVLTTHYMEEVEALADRLGIMKDGELLFVGSREELYRKSGKESVEDAFIHVVGGGDLDA